MEEIEKYIVHYRQFATVVLLDKFKILAVSNSVCFSFETIYRVEAIKKVILERTGDRTGSQ